MSYSSDSSISRSTSGSSTPSSMSEFMPAKIFLLSPALFNIPFLANFVEKLPKGFGDNIVIPINHLDISPRGWVQEAIKSLPGVGLEGKQWEKRPVEENCYFTEACEGVGVDEWVQACQGTSKVTSPADALHIFTSVGLRSIFGQPSSCGSGTLYVLERPAVSFPPLDLTRPWGVPTTQEWKDLWAAWDLVTLGMIPSDMLHQKPIDLRHKCLFYIGHIPTFLDMLMSRALNEPNTEPKNFTQIFERGIDPHVDDPEHCHRHSEVPTKDEDWPTLGTILAFRDRVRARLLALYDDFASGKRKINRNVGRMLAMTLEHEGWHVETLLYMLIQRAGTGTQPPAGFVPPPWEALSAQWDVTYMPPATLNVTLGPSSITLGHDDCEGKDFDDDVHDQVEGHQFGWDNESPSRQVEVGQFRVEWRPISNGEFHDWWVNRKEIGLPPSWVEAEEEIQVRTLYGPVPLHIAKHWPVLTSYDMFDMYAKSKGGRLPTEPELRLFLDTYEVGYGGGGNVGIRNWHPVPATAGLEDNGGRGTNGGVWEWTSTLFDKHEGLSPTEHFPGYSTDFFDGKHHVVLGASYATIPRLAGRRTVRNFYQHNYPYPWVGARVVYDA
ncbi:hypothetical protein M405DRAFT_814114 [Rhizopogon salebrosus TDB-379]|nr:hypothetical protein M405DRAFT_814114 [Rhizopogon salebrosus TDB-379]